MTIICVKDNIIAADTAEWIRDVIVDYRNKIYFNSDKSIVGSGCGPASTIEFLKQSIELDNFYLTHRIEDDHFTGIVWRRENNSWTAYYSKRETLDITQTPMLYAIGAGQELALGAMWAGASAEQAVQLCIDRHCLCGGTVCSLKLT